MGERILQARERQDSVGGITQTAVCGLPAGVGEPWFDSVESLLSHAVFSIGGVKGIEFGGGFSMACSGGSEVNDPFRMRDGRVVTATNHNGGINGGITNGMDVVFQCAVKPTPSIGQPQQTVDFLRMRDAELTIHGRHDPAIIRRICPRAGQRDGAGAVRPAGPALRHGLFYKGGRAMRCGLIGRRLGHSYSCQIHHALADYSYELWELEPEELAGFLEKQGFRGHQCDHPL